MFKKVIRKDFELRGLTLLLCVLLYSGVIMFLDDELSFSTCKFVVGLSRQPNISKNMLRTFSGSNRPKEKELSALVPKLNVRATVEYALVYPATFLTLTISLEKKLHGAYARMPGAALNVSWKDRLNSTAKYDQ